MLARIVTTRDVSFEPSLGPLPPNRNPQGTVIHKVGAPLLPRKININKASMGHSPSKPGSVFHDIWRETPQAAHSDWAISAHVFLGQPFAIFTCYVTITVVTVSHDKFTANLCGVVCFPKSQPCPLSAGVGSQAFRSIIFIET